MSKKTFSVTTLLVSILLLLATGCGNQNSVPSSSDEDKTSVDLYGSAQEVASPNALASELKSILGEACGAVKLTTVIPQNPVTGPMLVYVWKDKPIAEKLENAFKKQGYTIEMQGDALMVKKGDTLLVVSWIEEMESQEIGVGIVKEK